MIIICYNTSTKGSEIKKTNMIQPKPSLTVAIPAYNEQKGINFILKNILRQTQNKITLKDIRIYTDGCSDRTLEIAKKLQNAYPIIKIIEGKVRHGKMYRLNQIFSEFQSDILLLLDADIEIVGNNFLDNISEELIIDPKANMVVSHQIPLQPKKLIEKIIHATFLMWDYIRLSIPNLDHVQNFYPSATAYRGSFARTLHIPDKATEDRIYIYLCAKKTNSFRYTFKTIARYWTVTTIRDFINLSQRSFGAQQPELKKIFGEEVNTLHIIPLKYKIIGILKSFYHQPLYTPFAIFLGILLSKLTARKNICNTRLWEISKSSKKKYRI